MKKHLSFSTFLRILSRLSALVCLIIPQLRNSCNHFSKNIIYIEFVPKSSTTLKALLGSNEDPISSLKKKVFMKFYVRMVAMLIIMVKLLETLKLN